MKKQNKFTAKRLLALFMALAMCMSLFCTTAFAAEGDEGTTGSDSTPPSDSTATVKVEVTVDKEPTPDKPDVNVTVSDRPDVDSSKEETKEYKGEGTSGEGNGNVSATVEGSVTSKPDQDATETDPTHNNRVTHESGSIKGTEKDVITTPTEDVTPVGQEGTKSETFNPSDLNNAPEVDISFDKNGNATNVNNKGEKSETFSADLDALVNAFKPQKPDETKDWIASDDGTYTKSDVKEDGTETKTTWTVADAKDGKGWTTTETSTTVQKGTLDSSAFGWTAPENAKFNEETGTYTVTTKGEPDANGVTITTVTIYNPASGTFEKTTTKTTETTVTFSETSSGEIIVNDLSLEAGTNNGDVSSIVGLGPVKGLKTDEQLKALDRDGMLSAFKSGKANVVDLAKWARLHPDLKDNIPINHVLWTGLADKDSNAGKLNLFNYGFQSTVGINFANKDDPSYSAWLRRFVSGNQEFWVYCAQNGLGDEKGHSYELVSVNDANYLGIDAETAKHIQYIAENGYWATSSGTGSLKKMASLLTESQLNQAYTVNGKNYTLKDGITDGIALAATQAALWYYAHPADREVNGEVFKEDIFTKCWTRADGSKAGDLDANEKAAAMALFNALIAKDTKADDLNVNQTTDIISQEDIKGTSIAVTDKATTEEIEAIVNALDASEKEKAQTIYKDKDVYKTDLSLTVAVVPDNMNGEMKVIVYADGVKVKEQLLPQTNDAAGDAYKDGSLTVKIPGVVLPEGVNITLNLNGTQNLSEGAYLFRSDIDYSESQTMVGYVGAGGAQRDVDLNVNMKFEVTNPTVEKNTTVKATQTVTEVRDWSWSQDWTKDYTYPSDPTTPTTPPTTPPDNPPDNPPTDVPDPDVPLVPGPEPEEPPVDIPDDNPPLVDVPEEQPPLVEVPDPDVPLVPATPEVEVPDPEVPLADIPDEDVPLADVPNTGDVTGLWCALGLVSCAGLAYFFLDEKKRQNNAK